MVATAVLIAVVTITELLTVAIEPPRPAYGFRDSNVVF